MRALWLVILTSQLIEPALAGLVNIELRPPSQTVLVGDFVDIGVYAVSADGNNQQVGLVGAVIIWDETRLDLTGVVNNGPFVWQASGFPGDPASLNSSHADGDAYYQAVVAFGGPLATATPAGLLVATVRFTARNAATGSTQVDIVACGGATCSAVLDRHPLAGGVFNITGTLSVPVMANIECNADPQCDDDNACTDDLCDLDAFCANIPNDANDPDDFLYCNGQEIACDGGQIVIEPGSVPDCDDQLPCTTDSCNEALDVCDHALVAQRCLIANACYVANALNPANDCQECRPALSTTTWSSRASGSACGSANESDCDHPDTCNGSGSCVANLDPLGTPCGDSLNDTCTDPDTCDATGHCVTNNATNNTPCNDGQFCTVTDVCIAGLCLGSGVRCPSQVCDEFDNVCESVILEWRNVQPNPVAVGQEVRLGLFVVSTSGFNQPFSALSVVLNWDPTRLTLLGKIDEGPYPWLSSSFPNDSALDGLNDSYGDGDALYQALGRLAPNPVAVATTTGLHVTTIRFQAMQAIPAQVIINTTYAGQSHSEVLDIQPAGLNMLAGAGNPAQIQIVQCLNGGHCNDNEFCNGVEQCVSNLCVPGTPPNCSDGQFCNGVEFCQPGGVGCVSPGNPCPLPATCNEGSDDCGGCKAPTVVASGGRYLTITPAPGTNPVALRITGDPAFNNVACVDRYVTPTGHIGLEPVFLTPAEWGTIHASSCVMRPNTNYGVQTDCRNVMAGLLSNKIVAKTWQWGDVNGNGSVNFLDLSATLDATTGSYSGGVTPQSTDLVPCTVENVVSLSDVFAVQSAISGIPYPCPTPCFNGVPARACPGHIPTLSAWGLAMLALVLTCAASVILRRANGAMDSPGRFCNNPR